MRPVIFHKHVFILFIFTVLTACNSITTKNHLNNDEINIVLEHQQKADAAYDVENWSLAIEHYEALVKLHPNNDSVWFRLGNCYSQANKNEQALLAYTKAYEIEPKNTKAWHNKGTLQLRMATDTFVKMQEHATAEDPYAKRGRYVVRSIQDILQKGFGVSIDNE